MFIVKQTEFNRPFVSIPIDWNNPHRLIPIAA